MVLIAAGAVLVLWTAESENDRVIGILPVLGLMGVNFFLHGRYLMEKPGNQALIATASMIDVAIITVVVMFVGDETGLSSPFFIMLLPGPAGVRLRDAEEDHPGLHGGRSWRLRRGGHSG